MAITVQALDLSTLEVTFDAPPIEAEAEDVTRWTLTPETGAPAQGVVVVDAELSGLVLTLSTYPLMSGGQTYTLDGALSTPETDDFVVPVVEMDAADPHHPHDALARAIGRAFNALFGEVRSELAQPFAPGDTRLILASTYRFPSSGAVYIDVGHERFRATYTSRTSGTLEGVTVERLVLEPLPEYSAVIVDELAIPADDGPQPMSELREAICDTLLTHARDASFDALVRSFHFPRPHYISIPAWRRAVLAAVWGKRGTPGCIEAFLEGALSDYDVVLDVELQPAQPTRIYSPDSEFEQAHVGRSIRLPDLGLFRIVGPPDIATSAGAWVEVCPIKTAGWDAPNWADLDANTDVPGARILPFEVHTPTPAPQSVLLTPPVNGVRPGSPALIRIYILEQLEAGAPPTYMQNIDEEIDDEHDDSDDDDAWGSESWLFTADTGTDTLTTDTEHDLEADEVVVAHAEDGAVMTGNLAIDTDYYVLNPTADTLQLAATAGGPAIDLGPGAGSGNLRLYRYRPAGQPMGGHVQENVDDEAGTPGPIPIYLIGPTVLDDLALVMREIVVAGVHVEIRPWAMP